MMSQIIRFAKLLHGNAFILFEHSHKVLIIGKSQLISNLLIAQVGTIQQLFCFVDFTDIDIFLDRHPQLLAKPACQVVLVITKLSGNIVQG